MLIFYPYGLDIEPEEVLQNFAKKAGDNCLKKTPIFELMVQTNDPEGVASSTLPMFPTLPSMNPH
jgi:hypothetical protein